MSTCPIYPNLATEALYRITAGSPRPFCAGLVTRNGTVITAAPVLRRFIGRRIDAVTGEAMYFGWAVEAVNWRYA